jgi:hypothetical protein
MALSAFKKQAFGKYSFNVCQATTYIDGLDILQTYNDSFDKPKEMKRMIFHIKGKAFMRSVVADFDKTVESKQVDEEHLNGLLTGLKIEPVDLANPDNVKNILPAIKYQYMIREISKTKGSSKNILELKVHPLIAIGLAMWMCESFASEVKDMFIRVLNGDLTLITDIIEHKNEQTGMVNNVTTATDETGKVHSLVKTYDPDSFDAKYDCKILLEQIEALKQTDVEQRAVIINQRSEIKELISKVDNQTAEIQKLLTHAQDAKVSLDNANATLNDTNTIVRNTCRKLAIAVEDRVLKDGIDSKHNSYLVIIRIDAPLNGERDYYAICCKQRDLQARIKSVVADRDTASVILKIKSPCANTLWNKYITDYGEHIDQKYRWFNLVEGRSERNMLIRLKKIHNNRKTVPIVDVAEQQ